MPARTNDYQKFVAFIEKALAPQNAKVTESAMVSVAGMTGLREVDILIEGQFGPYAMKVAVEAKDEGRPLDVTVVEQLISKYTGRCSIEVNKFVIVSRNGFTKGATEKAAAADVELLTFEEAKRKEWRKVGKPKMQFRVAPHIHGISLLPKLPVVDHNFAYSTGRLICHRGHDHNTPVAFAKCFFFHKWLPHNEAKYREAEQYIRDNHSGNGIMTMGIPFEHWRLRLGGVDHPFETFNINVHIVSQEGPCEHTTYERKSSKTESTLVHHIKGTAGSHQLEIAIPQGKPIEITRGENSLFSPPTKEELSKAIQEMFPKGMTVKISSAPSPTHTPPKNAKPQKPRTRKQSKGKKGS